ncbi:hypothetical protein CFIMG_001359RA [Ceratocystis fimbriata CBS 114723]|uniref:GPI anchored serine-threonine rich protein n=1 Tax=Ceratocystis fimbriata CBS 114723 TaxID=1035309 RepID=A0A2C5XE39_9PEZI|nr:hypothetical protein CFIMG_001359RA [Ceratocystis fimbriata CBS 114723]
MKFSTVAIFIAASAASVAAVDESCNAANIVEACIGMTQPRVDACTGNDWSCLCSAYTDLATCYNNCPNDPSGFSAQQQVDSYCAAASQFPASTAASSGAATGTGSVATATTTGSSRSSSTASGSGSSASETASLETTGAGAKMAISGAAIVAAFAALV